MIAESETYTFNQLRPYIDKRTLRFGRTPDWRPHLGRSHEDQAERAPWLYYPSSLTSGQLPLIEYMVSNNSGLTADDTVVSELDPPVALKFLGLNPERSVGCPAGKCQKSASLHKWCG
jgi:hypothetical protein